MIGADRGRGQRRGVGVDGKQRLDLKAGGGGDLGGGLVGCETGIYLAKQGHRVTVIEAQPRVAPEAVGMYRTALLDEMKKSEIEVLRNTQCVRIVPGGVETKRQVHGSRTIWADNVVYSLGMQSVDYSEIRMEAGEIPIVAVGDCASVGKAGDAISSAYRAAMEIL